MADWTARYAAASSAPTMVREAIRQCWHDQVLLLKTYPESMLHPAGPNRPAARWKRSCSGSSTR